MKFHFLYKMLLSSFIAISSFASTAQASIYVSNSDDDTVSVINSETNTVTTTVTVGTQPESLQASPNRNFVYVVNAGSNNISVIDTSNNTVSTTITVGSNPAGIAVSPDSEFVYVSNRNDNTVSIIETETHTVTSTINVGTTPRGLAISPDGTTLYVANTGDDSISAVNLTTDIAETIALADGSFPINLTVSHDGTVLYVSNFLGASISVIDTTNSIVLNSIQVGFEPYGVILTEDDSILYVLNAGDDNIDIISTETLTITSTATTGNFPRQAVLNNDESQLYVVESFSNTVGIIDTTSLERSTITVGETPFGIAILEDEDIQLSLTLGTYEEELNSSGEASVNEDFHYTITITNTGTDDATNVQLALLKDVVPTYDNRISELVEIITDSTENSNFIDFISCSEELICDLGTLPAGESRYFHVLMNPSSSNTDLPYEDNFSTTVTSGDISVTETISLSIVEEASSNDDSSDEDNNATCTLNARPHHKADLKQELNSTLFLLLGCTSFFVFLRLRKN